MTPHYVTHFDKGYLARGTLMLESVIRHSPDAQITVVHHDTDVRRVIQAELGNRINLVDQRAILRRFPVLKRLRSERAPWPFYATLKPALVLYVLDKFARPDEWVASIDADTLFYSDPAPGYAGLGDADIAITPHRFSPEMPSDIGRMYGEFNAGFILFRKTDLGRKCLQDWLDDCVASCDPTKTNSQFMNQGYLDTWPERYSGIHILDDPAINLAYWNLANHRLSRGQDGPLVDGMPLIFFHFSDHTRLAPGQWQRQDQPSMHRPEVIDLLFGPLENMLEARITEFRAKYQMAAPKSHKKREEPLGRKNALASVIHAIVSFLKPRI